MSAALSAAALADVLAGARATVLAAAGEEIVATASRWDVPALAERLGAAGAEVQLVAAADTRDRTGAFSVLCVFAPAGGRPRASVRVAVPQLDPRFASLAARSFAASRFEREIHDLFGLLPVGHPDLGRLVLHPFWPESYHPLLRDTRARTSFVDRGQPFPSPRVEGPALVGLEMGPVVAGTAEPVQLRFAVDGDTIVGLEARLGFAHKGTEKLFETLPFERTWALAERVSGDSTAAHALAYCLALERLTGCTPPASASWRRVVLLELERLYNHVGDVGAILGEAGFAAASARSLRLRERLLRLNERAAGHRLLRGSIVPGGVTGALLTADLPAVAQDVADAARELAEVARGLREDGLTRERMQGVGRLTPRAARDMQVVGPVGRASGLDADARRDAPFAAYGELDVRVPVHAAGDVWARLMVRVDEIAEAARLIGRAGAQSGPGAAPAALPPLPADAQAVAVVEASRGPLWYWVFARGARALTRVKVADPSFRNWPALECAAIDVGLSQFPLCLASFNLSCAGADL